MKKITYTISFAFAMLATSNAIAQQGFGTNRPDKSAAVEIKSPNKGLLIPRIALTSTTDVTTVLNPANSLLVYNEAASNGLHAGYYYFKASANKWIPLLDETIQSHATVTQDGQNLSVVSTQTTNTNGSTSTDYKVKITPGSDKQFLATKLVGTELQTAWVSYADVMEVTNGLTKTGNTIKLGGRLTEDTTIITDGNAVMIQGLSTVPNMTDQVVAVGHYQTGEVKVATPAQIVEAGIAAENGITANGNTVKLGGNLTEDTTIVTAGNKVMIQGLSQVPDMTDQVVAVGHYQTGEVKVATPGQIVSSTLADGSGTTAVFDSTAQTNKVNLGGLLTEDAVITTTTTETLAIAGLQDFTGDQKSIVVLGPGNVLQKASLNTSNAITTVTANHTALTTDETILVDATGANVTVTIPPATTENKGKRYYIKLIATNVGHTNSVIIDSTSNIDGDASAIESSSPYQAWLLQSNGAEWFVVGN